MSVITLSREIAAPIAKVWATLDDFGGVHRFSASVESSPINEGTPSSGVGSERNCHLYDGNHIQERVVESVPEKKISIEIFDTSMPLKEGHGTFALSPTPSGGTLVHMTMEYVVKYGPLGVLMDKLMMKRMLAPSLDRLLAGLEHHVLTGESIGKGWEPGQQERAVA